jgi:hypothetical protein
MISFGSLEFSTKASIGLLSKLSGLTPIESQAAKAS